MALNSDSDLLLSAGIVANLPIDGLDFFIGYSENFAAIKDEIREASTLLSIEPETADNKDLGIRYQSTELDATLTFYQVNFENRLTFIPPDSDIGIDYLIGTNGSYVNTGGIESSGVEASINLYPTEYISVYASYTANDSTYTDGSIDFAAGETVYGSVEDMAVVSLDWNKEKYFSGISTKWVGDRQDYQSYVVSDLYVGMKLANVSDLKNVELRMTVNNLFDSSYLGGISGFGAWIGAPRTATLNIRADF